jgi:NADH dehydrogenase [ubiquinone] 1 alpha subcomplex assembly factor 1
MPSAMSRRTPPLDAPRPRRLARWLLLPVLPLVLDVSAPRPARPEAPGVPPSLFEFDGGPDDAWEVVNDGVMGGRSAGFVAVQDGTLRFTGTLVTQGGGFTSVRARRVLDLTGMAGVELRVRGSGRVFEIELDDGWRAYGRTVSRRAPFPTTAEWTVVRVPFDALRSSIFGQRVNAPPIDPARLRGVGIYIADGRDGAFRLDVDYVRAYAAPAADSAPRG